MTTVMNQWLPWQQPDERVSQHPSCGTPPPTVGSAPAPRPDLAEEEVTSVRGREAELT